MRSFKSGDQLSAKSIFIWRIIQAAVWLVGIYLVGALLFFPKTGLLLFWNVLIPVAPFLFVMATGVWRNVCPLATTVLLPRHLGLSERRKLTTAQSGKLGFLAIIILFAIVPLRHAVFNTNGPASAWLIISLAFTGFVSGLFYEWKSAWCSGLCPVSAVEKLYGGNVVHTVPNAHCAQCMNCVVPCPDSTPNIHPLAAQKTIWHRMGGWLITGGLPGFIWGWFHVPDDTVIRDMNSLWAVYAAPLMGMMVSLFFYVLLTALMPEKWERKTVACFAAAGVSCYYWFRVPALFGFGEFATDGLLIDLSATVPPFTITVFTILITVFFFYWLVFRPFNKKSWVVRPMYHKSIRANPHRKSA